MKKIILNTLVLLNCTGLFTINAQTNLEVDGASILNGKTEIVSVNEPDFVGGFFGGALQLRNPSSEVNAGPFITGHNSLDINTQLWFLGSGNVFDQNAHFYNRLNAGLELGTNNLPRLTILGDGKIGIGTIVPEHQLHVLGTSPNTPALKVQGGNILCQSNGVPGLFMRNAAGSAGGSIIADVANGNTPGEGIDIKVAASDDIHFISGGESSTTKLFIQQDGRVGVGTTSPTARLHVEGESEGAAALRLETGNISNLSDNKPGMYLRELDGTFAAAVYADVAASQASLSDLRLESSSGIEFTTGNTPSLTRFLINIFGQVGVGLDNPNTALHVKSQNNISERGIKLESSSSTLNWEMSVFNGNFSFFYNDGGVPVSWIETDGDYNPSDKRLKKDISAYKNVLQDVNKLNIINYRLKEDMGDSKLSMGVIAQEIEKFFPEIASSNKTRDGKSFIGVNYSKLGVISIKAIQEQQKIIETQEARITDLEQELADLKKLVEQSLDMRTSSPSFGQSTITLNAPATLKQNQPNPFTESTTIEYYIPEGTSTAQLQITDLKGQVMQVMNLDNKSAGQIQLKKGTLQAGSYFYSLLVDGKVVDTKQMVLTR